MPDPFISVEDLSDYLGRDVDSDPGALMAVDAACQIVRTHTEQDFEEIVAETITLDGTGTDTALLPKVPVQTAGTVLVNGTALEAGDWTFTESGHLIRTNGTAATDGTAVYSTFTSYPTAYWPQGRQNIEVTYEHGYAGGTVPADVRIVAVMIAFRLVTQGGAIQESIGDVSKRYAAAATDLTNGEKAILSKYRQPQ